MVDDANPHVTIGMVQQLLICYMFSPFQALCLYIWPSHHHSL